MALRERADHKSKYMSDHDKTRTSSYRASRGTHPSQYLKCSVENPIHSTDGLQTGKEIGLLILSISVYAS